MVIVENLTGNTNYIQRFECSASKIVVKANVISLSDLEAIFATIVAVDRVGVQRVITPRTNLRDLLEIAASNEGLVKIKVNYSSGSVASYDVLATLELSNFGAIDLAGGYGQIELDSCVTTSTFSFYGLDNPSLTQMIIKYEPIWAAQNQYKECDVNSAYAIAIPKANLVELQMQYSNGRTIIYKPSELDAIVQEINELAEVINNIGNTGASEVVVGSSKLYCLGVNDVVSIRVQYTQACTFYKISDGVLM